MVDRSPTTILPPTPRPGDCLPGSLRRRNARHVEAHIDRNIDSNNDPNNAASVFSNNVSNNFAYSSRNNAANSSSRSPRRSPLFSHRCSRRRSSQHSARYFGRYFLTNNGRYIERSNCAFGARSQSPGTSFQGGISARKLLCPMGTGSGVQGFRGSGSDPRHLCPSVFICGSPFWGRRPAMNLFHLRLAAVPGFWFLVPRLANSEFWSLVSEF